MVFWGACRTSAAGRWPPGAAFPVWRWGAFLLLDLQSNGSGFASAAPMARSARHQLGHASGPSGGVEAAQAEVVELRVDWWSPSVSSSAARPLAHGDRARPLC